MTPFLYFIIFWNVIISRTYEADGRKLFLEELASANGSRFQTSGVHAFQYLLFKIKRSEMLSVDKVENAINYYKGTENFR